MNNLDDYCPSLISEISHKLRIPLTGIFGMISLLNETPLSQRQKDSISILQECAEKLLAVTNEICELLQHTN